MVLGFLHNAFRDYVQASLGKEAWLQLMRRTGMLEDGEDPSWQSDCPYGDTHFFRLLGTAADLASMSVADLLRGYGRYFVVASTKRGYGKLLASFAASPVGLLTSLNALHVSLTMGFQQCVNPDIRAEKVTATSLELHYRSKRQGLHPLVEGIVQGMSELYLNGEPIEMKLIKGRVDKSCDHEVWRVTYPEDQHYLSKRQLLESDAASSMYSLDESAFYKLHPFHFVMDRHCHILQMGSSLKKLLPDFRPGDLASEHFQIRFPYTCQRGPWNASSLAACESEIFLIKCKGTSLEIKGQFVPSRSNKKREASIDTSSSRLLDRAPSESLKVRPSFLSTSSIASPAVDSEASSQLSQKPRSNAREILRNISLQLRRSGSKGKGRARAKSVCVPEDGAVLHGSTALAGSGFSETNSSLMGIEWQGKHASNAHECPVLMFLGSPRCLDLDNLKETGLAFDDLSLYDVSTDFVVLAELKEAERQECRRLQEERVALEARAALLSEQNRAHEATCVRLGEALEEALSNRDGQDQWRGFHVETPADKSLNLLDKLMYGIMPDIKEVMEVRDSIIQSMDMCAPIKLQDQMAVALANSNGGDPEVEAALTQLLASRRSDRFEEDSLSEIAESVISSSGNRHSREHPTYLFNDLSETRPAEPFRISKSGNSSSTVSVPSHASWKARSAARRASDSLLGKPDLSLKDNLSLQSPGLSQWLSTAHKSNDAYAKLTSDVSTPSSGELSQYNQQIFSNSTDAARDAEEGGEAATAREPTAAPGPRACPHSRPVVADSNALNTLSASPFRAGDLVRRGESAGPSFLLASSSTLDNGVVPSNSPAPCQRVKNRNYLLKMLKPPGGVEQLLRPLSDPVMSVLAKIDNWQFDTFELNEVTNGRPLSCLAFALLNRSSLLSRYHISETRLARFLIAVENSYSEHPYHNRIHAADVLRSMHVIMTRGGVRSALQNVHDLSLLAAYLGAVIHDFDHRGVTNDYLIKSQDPLALLYNDRSPMENHHAAAAFRLLILDESCAALAHTNAKVKDALRKLMVDLVLATDMKQHFSFVSLFNTKMPALMSPGGSSDATMSRRRESVELLSNCRWASSSARHSLSSNSQMLSNFPPHSSAPHAFGEPPRSPMHSTSNNLSGGRSSMQMSLSIADEELCTLVLQMALKCADLGHLTHAWPVHKRWVQQLEEELFRQGDLEKARNLPVSPLMDRNKSGITKSQTGFFSIVVLPQLQSFCQVFPGCRPMLEQALENYRSWCGEGAT